MNEIERDKVFVEVENILKQYLPYSYSEPQYVNDMATELMDWISEYINKKCDNCKGL